MNDDQNTEHTPGSPDNPDHISRDAVFDPETVIIQGTYRVGFLPPVKNSLAFGELFVELGEGVPALWIGTRKDGEHPGDIAVFSGSGEARDPPQPSEPAMALQTHQQHLAAQYNDPNAAQNREVPHPDPRYDPARSPEDRRVSTEEAQAEAEQERNVELRKVEQQREAERRAAQQSEQQRQGEHKPEQQRQGEHKPEQQRQGEHKPEPKPKR